jgi:hypothetical protein
MKMGTVLENGNGPILFSLLSPCGRGWRRGGFMKIGLAYFLSAKWKDR